MATCRSHRGKVREVNEDSVFIHPEGMLWAVADGMGGYEAGDMASGIVVAELAKLKSNGEVDALVKHCQQQLRIASARIQRYSQERCRGRHVGSTVVCMMAAPDGVACIWAGDSRLYRMRGSELVQLSADHSEVAKLVELGHLTEEEAKNHPRSNIITRTIGIGARQDTERTGVDAKNGDLFLLCSDGLCNELDDDAIVECLQSESLESMADELISRSLLTQARDNISFVLMSCVEAED